MMDLKATAEQLYAEIASGDALTRVTMAGDRIRAIQSALQAAVNAQRQRDLTMARFEICGPKCSHECCRTARAIYADIEVGEGEA